jgi:putative ABC transport system permease protein
LTIVGIVKDFHLLSLKKQIVPLLITQLTHRDWTMVRVDPDHSDAAIASLQKTWQSLAPDKPFEYQLLDKEFQSDYKHDLELKQVLSYSSAVAIVLACLGLVGLVAITVTNRIKEIGIRKVLGASVANVSLMPWDSTKFLLIANLVGLPIAVYALSRWIEAYPYRMEMEWWVFAIAGFIVIAVALIPVCFQAVRVSLSNPVDSLRSE